MPSKLHTKTYFANIVSLLLPIIALTTLLAGMEMALASTQALVEKPSGQLHANVAVHSLPSLPITITEKHKLTADDADQGDHFGENVAIDGDTIVVGAWNADAVAVDSGAAYIFERQGANWVQIKKLVASDGAFDDHFGRDVSIDGDTVAIGARYDNVGATKSGSVYIFERNQGGPDNWGEVKKITASDPRFEAFFGVRMVLRDDTLLVGAPAHNSSPQTGAAYLFERNQGGANNWGQVKKLVGSDSNPADSFAVGVDLSGDTIVLGASLHDSAGSNAGAAYIFERNQGGPDNWGEVKKITASDAAAGDDFGKEVAIEGDTVVVGAPFEDEQGTSSGAAYVFERNEGGPDNWGQVDKLLPSNGTAGDAFSWNVLLRDNNLLIGAPQSYNNQSGAAYLFQYHNGQWQEIAQLDASDEESNDNFGVWAGWSHSVVVIGAREGDDACPANPNCNSGSAYVFELPAGPIVNKTVTPDLAEPGDIITYSIQFSNTSSFVVTGGILTDIVPVGVTNVSYVNSGVMITPTGMVSYTWQVADIPPGGSGIITITGVIDVNLSSEGMITNTAVFSPTPPNINPTQATAVLEINIPPELAVNRFYEISEGQFITLTGVITDPGSLDSLVLVVDWGDGLTETVNYPPGTTNFQQPHPYSDDHPSNTPVDEYPINLSLFDSDGGFTQQLALATVHNVTPTVDIGADMEVPLGEMITFTAIITDPGLLDTFTWLWDMDDGTVISNTLMPSHVYSMTGNYTVTLVVTDDDTYTGQDALIVSVRVPESDLSISKSVTPEQILPDDPLTYTLAFTNGGPDRANNVYITDTLPISLTNLSYHSSGVDIIEIGNTPYSWLLEELAVGQSGFITITGRLTTTISSEYTLWNSAIITSTSRDIMPLNNSASVPVDINLSPTIQVDDPDTVMEGDSFNLTGSLSDLGDMIEMSIDWGGTLTETAIYPAGSHTFTLTHIYPDDNPTGTVSDTYTITLHLSDSDGAASSDEAFVTVYNVSPDVVASAAQTTTQSGVALDFNGVFTDPGLKDTFTILWDFGDGITTTDTLTPAHVYANAGIYTASLSVSDDDGGVGQDTLIVQVESLRLFIPFIVNDRCSTQFDPVDVVLAIDASNSMGTATSPGGISKIAAAQAAAVIFLDFLPFPQSQAAIVSFNNEAVLEQPLTTDQATLTAAIQNLTLSTLTRLDLALIISRSELVGPRHQPDNEAVLIMLTDGIPAGITEAEVLAEAAATKAAGITIYTIGLGENVDAELLQAVASSPDLYYEAPSASDLANIYTQIANVIQCGNS